MPVQTVIKLRRDTAANWATTNPILAAGEQGYETNTGLSKIGDGINAWDALPYAAVSRITEEVKNSTGVTITKGSVVYISGSTGDNALISLSDADTEATSSKTLGLVAANIADGATGMVVCEGLISGVNTGSATAGQSVWLSSTAGAFVFNAPPAKPAHSVYLGVVIRAHSVNGEILVKVQNGYELNELHDVNAASPSDNNVLAWDSATSMWTNQTAAQANLATAADPTFTGTVTGVTKAHVGLSNVDNTSDASKPVSTATQTALNGKLNLSGGTMTGALTLSGAPSSDLHAATKSYVDNVVSGLNFHNPVKAATTANISLSGTQTIDGVALAVGDRVLVKDQTNQTQNGIYVVASLGWTRATDADNTPSGELAGGDFVFVLNGTVNAGFGFVCSNTSAITIGSTNITYVPFNAGHTVVAGNGLQEATPGTLSIDTSITQTRVSGVTDTEIGYLDGVTSAIQTQLDGKTSNSSYSAKGVILVGTGSGTFVAQSVGTNGQVLTANSAQADGVEWTTPATGGASTSGTLAQFAATTSAQLAGVISDETGSGALVFGTSPTLLTPIISGPTLILSTTAATQAGRLSYNGSTLRLGNGTSTVTLSDDAALVLAQSQVTNLVTDLAGKAPSLAILNQQTASYTLVLADRDKMVEISSGSAITLTVPADATVAFPTGTRIEILQTGTGQITVAGAGSVAVNGTPGLRLRAQWSSAMLIKRAANTWVLIGDLVS
jgi:hypothetical protein